MGPNLRKSSKNKKREDGSNPTANSKAVLLVYPSQISITRVTDLTDDLLLAFRAKKIESKNTGLEEGVIVFEMDNVVEGAAIANKRFGVEKVAIARKISNANFEQISSEIAQIGKLKVLPKERFFVKVQISKDARVNYKPRDLEFASTGDIISAIMSCSNLRSNTSEVHYPLPARNETEADRTLEAYVGKSGAYICIEQDKGLGGLPLGSQREKVLCAFYDTLSCISCVSMLKCGFLPEIVVLYTDDENLRQNLKMLRFVINKLRTRSYTIRLAQVNLSGLVPAQPQSESTQPGQQEQIQKRQIQTQTQLQKQKQKQGLPQKQGQYGAEDYNQLVGKETDRGIRQSVKRRVEVGVGEEEEERKDKQDKPVIETPPSTMGYHDGILKCLIAIQILSQMNEQNIVLPFSSAVHPVWLIESAFKKIVALNKVPWMPLLLPIQALHEIAGELGMNEYKPFVSTTEIFNEAESGSIFTGRTYKKYSRAIDKLTEEAMKDMRNVSFEIGPNYLHNILDSI